MQESIMLLKNRFDEINKMGYVESTRRGTTGIGKTFEDLLGKKEDRSSDPDFHGIEVKTKLAYSVRPTTLFNQTPQGKQEHEIKRIVDTYGYPDKTLKWCKVFYATIYGNCLSMIAAKYLMGLKVDRENRKIILKIINLDMELIEDYVYWDFDELEYRLNKKLKYLALVNASKKYEKGMSYYHYRSIDFYKLKDFETFLNLIEIGIICVTFKISVIKRGPRMGEISDKGTCFRINESNITELFERILIEEDQGEQ